MPIFQDPDRFPSTAGTDDDNVNRTFNMRRPSELSEVSLRTEFCEGPVEDTEMAESSPVDKLMGAIEDARLETNDRVELIQRLKRDRSPVWVPNWNLEEPRKDSDNKQDASGWDGRSLSTDVAPSTYGLLPFYKHKDTQSEDRTEQEGLASPSEIQRPRSALHSGDFRDESPSRLSRPSSSEKRNDESKLYQGRFFESSTSTPWYNPHPTSDAAQSPPRPTLPYTRPAIQERGPSRTRAPSLGSFSSSFIYKPPTSPLVQQSNNTDLDFSPKVQPVDFSASFDKASRRRTLPPGSFSSLRSSPQSQPIGLSSTKPLPSIRREGTFPYQAHQPRRSLTSSHSFQGATSPPSSAMFRSRRPSFSSDSSSPLQHASMVGSYEESILRGRMSTTPSKPLDFTAQIGVLGKGKCKPNLKCPSHVTVPFPAVFYSYASTAGNGSFSEDGPSPYVGQIDLENSLKPQDGRQKKPRRRHTELGAGAAEMDSEDLRSSTREDHSEQDRRKREKTRRRSKSPRSPPGGCYRIPEQGQLQIIIKNPNKTAVKLFLVPYDLEGMESGSKTFVRQRSYSAGPILDMPAQGQKYQDPEASKDTSTYSKASQDRPILRYLIHLNICSPSKGRYYLYKNIRVVFANRVPDGKEKLRNELQVPDPKYSPWKASNDPLPMGSAGAKLAAEKAYRRRSSGFPLNHRGLDGIDEFSQAPLFPQLKDLPPTPAIPSLPLTPLPLPFYKQNLPSVASPEKTQDMDIEQTGHSRPDSPNSPTTDAHARFTSMESSTSSLSTNGSDGYSKLSKGDQGYGGNLFGISPSTHGEIGESLLARRLREMGVRKEEGMDREKL